MGFIYWGVYFSTVRQEYVKVFLWVAFWVLCICGRPYGYSLQGSCHKRAVYLLGVLKIPLIVFLCYLEAFLDFEEPPKKCKAF